MSIQETPYNSKAGTVPRTIATQIRKVLTQDDLFSAVLLVAVALISFGLGRQSVVAAPDTAWHASYASEPSGVQGVEAPLAHYVASKKGSTYHLPWCPGALRINEENKIIFTSKEAAESAGYTPAANCAGI